MKPNRDYAVPGDRVVISTDRGDVMGHVEAILGNEASILLLSGELLRSVPLRDFRHADTADIMKLSGCSLAPSDDLHERAGELQMLRGRAEHLLSLQPERPIQSVVGLVNERRSLGAGLLRFLQRGGNVGEYEALHEGDDIAAARAAFGTLSARLGGEVATLGGRPSWASAHGPERR